MNIKNLIFGLILMLTLTAVVLFGGFATKPARADMSQNNGQVVNVHLEQADRVPQSELRLFGD